MNIKVALIEDDDNLRKDLIELLSMDSECNTIGAFSNAEAAIAELPNLAPNVVISDINLPGLSGIECVRYLSEKLPDTQFLMLTVFKDTERIFEAIAAGAHGYLVKPVRRKQLMEAVRDVVAGGAPLTSIIARSIISHLKKGESDREAQAENAHEQIQIFNQKVESLSSREKSVLDNLVKGMLYKEIATEMNLSLNTVCEYIRRIYKKLQVHSREEAVARFQQSKGSP